MSRYIDADKLFLHFNDWALAMSPDERHSYVPEYSEHKIHEMIYRTINEAMSAIEEQPTADVVEVVHGQWIDTETGKCMCSHCKDIHEIKAKFLYSYCPNCGAKIDNRREIERGHNEQIH